MYAIEVFNTVLFALLVGSGALFVMLVILGLVIRLFGSGDTVGTQQRFPFDKKPKPNPPPVIFAYCSKQPPLPN